VNLYIANGGVVAPALGDDKREDEEARAALQKAFPDREVMYSTLFGFASKRQASGG
jgi:agmatine/peptidylarginine deiminase